MRSLALLLHFYQPPTQSPEITEQVLRSCYLPLADLLLAHPEAQFTLNIAMNPGPEFVEKIKTLLKRKQIELSNSPIYHPLLPLIPVEDIDVMLRINRDILRDTFQTEPADIIFPPELAIKPQIYKPNYIVDESAINPDFDVNKIPKLPTHVSSRAITEILRSYPTVLTKEIFLKFLEERTDSNQTIMAATDAEIFGHHYTERINLIKELLESKKIKFIKVTDIDAIAPLQHDVVASSWQTTDLTNPFPLWQGTDLQKKYDDLAQLAFRLLSKSPDHNSSAESHYFKGISSCHYYWLSNWPWWHPDLVESGARELIKSVRSLYIGKDQKLPAEALYHDLSLGIWSYHWSGKVEEKWREYNKYRETFLKTWPVMSC